MRSTKLSAAIVLTLAMAGGFACSSDSDNGGSGGSSGSGGSGGSAGRGGSGGSSSSGGTTGGSSSTGGTTGGSSSTGGTGGSTGGTGGSTGGSAGGTGGSTGGTGGSTGGTGGSTGGTGGSTGGTGGSATDGGKMDGMTAMETGGTGAFMISGDFVMMGDRLCHKAGQTRLTMGPGGTNKSPALMWGKVPEGTVSIAVSLKDLTNQGIHWVMWDIPVTETGLAAAIPAGAAPGAPAPMGSQQSNTWYGPGAGGAPHRYEYQVWALKARVMGTRDKGMIYNTILPREKLDSKILYAWGSDTNRCQ